MENHSDIKLNLDNISKFITENEWNESLKNVSGSFNTLVNRSGKGNEFLGWMDLPLKTSGNLLDEIEKTGRKLSSKSEIVVVTGIGGSYLGARAIISALGNNFPGYTRNGTTEVLYAGNNLSEDYLAELIPLLDEKDYSIIVISKSGTTTEPAIAFRILKNHLEKKYGKKEASGRIVAITDALKGALKQIAVRENYATFTIPDDVGGRYSVLTPVGLLPVAVAGFDIHELMKGAFLGMNHLLSTGKAPENNAIRYAAARNLLYKKGKTTEIMVSYNPKLYYFSEWWKQLFGESEGKENKGIFPSSAGFTTDLHSLGQYIQEGLRNIFETVISVENSMNTLYIPFSNDDSDGLNYISGKRLEEVNRKAQEGTLLAHVEGGVPNIVFRIPEISENTLGQMICFFEFSCALSGYTLGINPFDQPGVEAYKNNMFRLLGKPGY